MFEGGVQDYEMGHGGKRGTIGRAEGRTTEGAFKTLLNAGSTKRERNGHLARIVNPLNED